MAGATEWSYDELRQAMAQRMDSSRSSRRSSRTSPLQTSRRHSARVEKPRSYHPSPQTPERRHKPATARHYSAMEDHYRRMMGLDENEDQDVSTEQRFQPSVRPVSWHPGSTTVYDAYDNGYSSKHAEDPSPTSQYLSYHNSPFYHKPRPTTEPDITWSQYMHGRFEATSAPDSSMQQAYTSSFNNTETHTQNGRMTSAWMESHDDERRARREQSVELVGLGLYDEPGFTVKIGSKLEEECEPPEFEPTDDEDEESSEEEDEELPRPEDAKVAQTSMPLVDMSGRSFFLGPDEGLKNSWWTNSENKQQPSQVGAVNYGWI